jgi:hypothetical protein
MVSLLLGIVVFLQGTAVEAVLRVQRGDLGQPGQHGGNRPGQRPFR